MDIAEFNRRLESMAQRLGELVTQIAVRDERELARDEDIRELKVAVKSMGETFTKGKGAIWILTIAGGAMVTVVGFWDKVSKLWGH